MRSVLVLSANLTDTGFNDTVEVIVRQPWNTKLFLLSLVFC